LSDDSQTRIAESWNNAVEQHVAGMSEAEFAAMVSRTRSQSMSAKASQLWAVTQQCTDGNGYTRGMSDAAAARARPAAPPVEPPKFQPPQDTGYVGGSTLRRLPFTPPAAPTEGTPQR
jgi:hypothetical protein